MARHGYAPSRTEASEATDTVIQPRGAGHSAPVHADGGDAQVSDVSDILSISAEEKARIHVLIVDDERTLAESCASILRLEGYRVTTCNRGDEARSLLQRRSFQIALFDLYMSQVSGMELLRIALEASPDTIPIIMTGNPTVSSSVEALREGAWDYLPKPFSATHLQLLIGRAAHAVLIAQESNAQRDELQKEHGHSEKVTVLGNAPGFRQAIELARKVSATDASVFITGESGTGKELIAQFIHHHSRRSSRPLVAVNCAALPEALLESEMFGHCKGAFTGAVRDKPGLLETANGGTLFLDELTEMPPPLQAKLLRVIQDGVVRRVGSNNTDAVVNVRFIVATNQDPAEAVEEGSLRKDLYYRLRVVPIQIPPLRQRPDDIPVLANHFLAHYWSRHRDGSGKRPTFTAEAIRALQARPWSGNVRELQNVIEHAVVLAEAGAAIGPDDLPFLDEEPLRAAAPLFQPVADEQYHPARDRVISQFERRYLTWLVTRAAGNMSKAARIAGVDRTTLYRLMEKHGLQRATIIRLASDVP
jgi:DNA-binding NtrC family response regulator